MCERYVIDIKRKVESLGLIYSSDLEEVLYRLDKEKNDNRIDYALIILNDFHYFSFLHYPNTLNYLFEKEPYILPDFIKQHNIKYFSFFNGIEYKYVVLFEGELEDITNKIDRKIKELIVQQVMAK